LTVAAVTTLAVRGGGLAALQWALLILLTLLGAALIPAGVGLTRRREWARLTVLSGALAVSVVGLGFFAAAALDVRF
jgi:hypothetical protein